MGTSKVTFHFPHLNLDRLTKVMDKYLKTAREDWDSDLDFTFGANEGGAVKIDPENSRQTALIAGASGAGAWIKIFQMVKKERLYYAAKTNSWCVNSILRCLIIW